MGEILLTHPLIVLHLFYVLCLLPVLLWPDTPRPPRRQGTEPWGAFGAQRRVCLGSLLLRPPTTLPNARKEGKP